MHTKLKEYRIKNKLTQKQIAERAGLKESAYQRYEYGECAPSVWTAIRIARALGTTVEKIFPSPDGGNVTPNLEKQTLSFRPLTGDNYIST